MFAIPRWFASREEDLLLFSFISDTPDVYDHWATISLLLIESISHFDAPVACADIKLDHGIPAFTNALVLASQATGFEIFTVLVSDSAEDNDRSEKKTAKIHRKSLAAPAKRGKTPFRIHLLPKEGTLMRIRLLIPVLTFTALLGLCTDSVRAGSFFGPVCYGADYTYRYPNRSHNLFGCGPGCHCQAWHPLFRHRLFRRHSSAPLDGMPANVVPGDEAPPVNSMPLEHAQTPF